MDNHLSGERGSALRLAIGAIFKNEAPYIIEWVAYHRLIGFDRLFIADNNSTDGSTAILESLDAAGIINHIPFPHVPGSPPQLPAYAEIMRRHGGDADWIAFVDADEFLLPTDDARSIRPVIEDISGDQAVGAILVNWANYGSSGHTEPSDALTIERFTYRAEKEWSENFHYKSIVRSSAYVRPHGTPHHFVLREGLRMVHTDGSEVTIHPSRGVGLSEEHVWSRVRLNHYVVKSRNEFFGRKGPKGRATVVGQKKGEGYFTHHDRNEVLDPVPDWLIQATKREKDALELLVPQMILHSIRDNKGSTPSSRDRPSQPFFRGAIDQIRIDAFKVNLVGWAFDDGKPVEAFAIKIGSFLLSEFNISRVERPDVVRHYLNADRLTGYSITFPLLAIPEGELQSGSIELLAKSESGSGAGWSTVTYGSWPSKEAMAAVATMPFVGDVPSMSAASAAYIASLMSSASCYLEYGAGGTTVHAAKTGVPHVVSVESDQAWIEAVKHKVVSQYTKGSVNFICPDIGPTKEWGFPVSETHWKNYSAYPLDAWQICKEKGISPDLVFVNGRFRVACFLATILFAKIGCRMLFNEYRDRHQYELIESLVKPVRYIDRVAEFVVSHNVDRDAIWLAFVKAIADAR